jgi:hypothetical protein
VTATLITAAVLLVIIIVAVFGPRRFSGRI